MFLRAFATLLLRFGEGRAARAKARTGLAFVVSHPCLANSKYGQGHGKDGAPGGCDDFSDIFLHGVCPPGDYFYCALLGVNCMQSWRA